MFRKDRAQTVARKSPSKVTDPRRIRFGAGMAPVCLSLGRDENDATKDRRRIRFGAGMISAALKK
jgi:hypothetical protein